jgi:hypothetical protein
MLHPIKSLGTAQVDFGHCSILELGCFVPVVSLTAQHTIDAGPPDTQPADDFRGA